MQSQIERFLEHIARKGYAANTVLAYRGDLKQLREYLERKGKATWKQVEDQDIEDYLLYLQEREYASSTVSRKMAAVSSFFRFLMLQEIIFDDPTSNISLSQTKRSWAKDVLSDEKVEQLLAHVAQDQTPKGLRDQVLLNLIAQAGFRPSEMVSLDLEDVEALSSRLPVLTPGGEDPQERTSLQAALERYVREGRPQFASSEEESALFLSLEVGVGGGRLTRQGIWLIVKRRAEACGLEERISPRVLHRTYLVRRQREQH
ncbi:MAG: site-specific integrase [Chloroflexota bacterium]|nr:site-specific integrase [Chloroflexota bacterium]